MNATSILKFSGALGAKWLKIIFVMWRDYKPYDENYHLANMARQRMRQVT